MNKQETDILKEECIDYILNLPIKVNWKRSESIMTSLSSCDATKLHYGTDLVPSWEEEDGKNCHLIVSFMADDRYYNSKNETKFNGLQVAIERYSCKSYEWNTKMYFVVKSLEQFKHIITGIIKI